MLKQNEQRMRLEVRLHSPVDSLLMLNDDDMYFSSLLLQPRCRATFAVCHYMDAGYFKFFHTLNRNEPSSTLEVGENYLVRA